MASTSRSNLSREDIKAADIDEKETLLEHDSEPDEDMIFNRPTNSNGIDKSNVQMDNVRIQIQEVTEVMRDNVKKVMERGERLEELQDASDRLAIAGNQFRDAAKKAQRRAWLQNVKSRIVIITITLTIVVFIVVLDILALYLVLR